MTGPADAPVRALHPDGSPLDGLSLDAMGCLVRLADPVPALTAWTVERGVVAPAATIASALRAEVAFYRRHHLDGRDPVSLRRLRRACAEVFLTAVVDDADGAPRRDHGPAEGHGGAGSGGAGPGGAGPFRPRIPPLDDNAVDEFVDALRFELLPGVADELERLDAAGVPMVCVSNWDCALPDHLESLGIARRFRAIVPSATAGLDKPDPRIFAVALRALGLPAARVAHLGDEAVDRDGARAAGMPFLDPPVAGLAQRLGL
ncbi:MAG: HAD-IA family hydrolase [Solirubrobacteraceae bacterium]